MGDIASQASTTTHGGSSEMVAISAKILVATITVVFVLLALLVVVHLYAKWYWLTNAQEDLRVVSWRRRAARQGRRSARTRGLNPRALELVPEMEYDPKGFKEGLECVVCLSEVTQGETIRLLPKCNHGFHVTCIDMWFHSHSTCPLCRNPVVLDQNPSNNDHVNGVELQEIDVSSSSESETDDDHSSYGSPHANETPSFPTNVLFWGNETQVRSFGQPSEEASTSTTSSNNISDGVDRHRDALVIDIPRQLLCEDCLPLPQELKDNCDGESKSPVVTTLRSLRRLLSRGKRVAPSPRGSSSIENEQV